MTEFGSGYTTDAELKKSVHERLVKARHGGLTVGEVKKRSDGVFGVHDVFDMLEAKMLPEWVWKKMDEILKDFGY